MYLAPTHQYTIPSPGRRTRSIVLAVLMHGLLALMLFFGLRWQSSPPEVVNAELWSALPQIAAPAPTPTPPPPPVVAPKPPTPEPVEETPPPPPKPDIVIKEEPKKVPPKPPEPVPVPKVEIKPEPRPEPRPQPKPEVKAPPAPPSALQYIQNQVASATGTAAQTSGPRGSNSYIAALQAKIRSNTVFPGQAGITGNPTAIVEIEQLPTGEVTNTRIITSSGVPAFDEAVLNGVEKSSPLPKDENGRVVTPVQLTYKLFPNR
ncbi:MAG: cell envelope integrity protein TolA [Burkholderiaceae bacterium]|jgi:colicin import membrane protein